MISLPSRVRTALFLFTAGAVMGCGGSSNRPVVGSFRATLTRTTQGSCPAPLTPALPLHATITVTHASETDVRVDVVTDGGPTCAFTASSNDYNLFGIDKAPPTCGLPPVKLQFDNGSYAVGGDHRTVEFTYLSPKGTGGDCVARDLWVED